MLKKLTAYFQKYERHIGIATLIGGFIFDNFFLVSPDNVRDNIGFILYLSIASLSILLINIFRKGYVHSIALFIMQFVLGGLFSMSLVFYSRGATLEASWPFLMTLVLYMIANEFLKKHYLLLAAQISAFFIALYTYLIFVAPVLLRRMDDYVFLLSGAASLVFITLFIIILSFVNKAEIKKSRKALVTVIPSIFILINVFYFTNLIPPIPLLLKDMSVHHSVMRVNAEYIVESEEKENGSFFSPIEVHVAPGEDIYVFSSVFAPVSLTADLRHVWQYYDERSGRWSARSDVRIPIYGGRAGGYRMYSVKSNLEEGLWRVDVTTARGQIIGRIKFKVEKVETVPKLVTEIK